MKIYGYQFDIAWEDKAANFGKVRNLLAASKPEAGSLVFLPEMFASGFSMNINVIAEDSVCGPTMQFLAQCAAQFGVYVAGGLAVRGDDGKARNELLVVAPDGKRIVRYAKLHPFTFGKESLHYAAGDQVQCFSWAGMTVSPFICYDLRFPEIFRHAMRGGAELMAVIANWPLPREEHWVTLLRARAIENQAYIIGVNRCGRDPYLVYPGRSLIVDPHGTVIVDAGNVERVISAEIDIAMLRAYRAQFPILGDQRPEFLGAD